MRILGGYNYRRIIKVEKNGRIILPMSIVKEMQIKEGDVCGIGEKEGEYYFLIIMRYVSNLPRMRGAVWGIRRHGKVVSYGFSNKQLAKEILRMTGDCDNARLMIGSLTEIDGERAATIIIKKK